MTTPSGPPRATSVSDRVAQESARNVERKSHGRWPQAKRPTPALPGQPWLTPADEASGGLLRSQIAPFTNSSQLRTFIRCAIAASRCTICKSAHEKKPRLAGLLQSPLTDSNRRTPQRQMLPSQFRHVAPLPPRLCEHRSKVGRGAGLISTLSGVYRHLCRNRSFLGSVLWLPKHRGRRFP
jgi:hypothetical protein